MIFRKSNTNIEKTNPEADLHKLNRLELLEMLVEQGKEIEALRRQIENLEKQLEDRAIMLDKAGDLAAASLEINHVMDAAQQAARQYLDNVRLLCSRKEQETIDRCEAMEQASKARCAAWEAEACKAAQK